MALLAEELVEEWLNRAGYFTIRGVKLGVHEIDLLAVRPVTGGLECQPLSALPSSSAQIFSVRSSGYEDARPQAMIPNDHVPGPCRLRFQGR
jgi:hypothetical protein